MGPTARPGRVAGLAGSEDDVGSGNCGILFVYARRPDSYRTTGARCRPNTRPGTGAFKCNGNTARLANRQSFPLGS